MKEQRRAILALIAGNTIWGFSFMFSRLALRAASPITLLAARFTLAFAAMSLLRLTGVFRLRLRGKRLGGLLLLGLFEPVLYFLCESYGILYSSATFSGVMIALIPIASLAFGALFLREKPTAAQALFSLLSVAGVVLLTVSGGGDGLVTPKGAALMLGAVLSAVGFNLVSRKTAASFTAFERTYFMFLEGFLFYGALALMENAGRPEELLVPWRDGGFVAAVLFLGVASSVGAFFCMNYASTYLPVARTTAFANLTTVVSLFAGVLFLREPLSPAMLPAAAMIVAGVWGVQRFTARGPA